ncbi:MAG: bifunctional DNA primase/polymerase [Candidatus Thermoplasmatota archaeon]|nr:bifunctional DNA primase/polymerase [Candidatus Thermoplasmatota archaeon]
MNEKQGGSRFSLERGNEISNKYNIDELINLLIFTEPTQQALALEYGKIGFKVFPCDHNKAPIVDRSLGFIRGHKDATNDARLIIKTWSRYPNAAIGWAIPKDVMVLDPDVRKDQNKRPVQVDGHLDKIGIQSLRKLATELNIELSELWTLIAETQSGARHFIYRMPEGVYSFCRTHAMEGLDLKGEGGYIILPNSEGQFGKYKFLIPTEIRPIPEPLLKWVLQFREPKGEFRKLPAGSANIDREEIITILKPYWAKGDGRRNDLTMAIAGFIARSGGSEDDATFIISELARMTGKGRDHVSGAKYAFRREGPVKGFNSLAQLMEEIEESKEGTEQ